MVLIELLSPKVAAIAVFSGVRLFLICYVNARNLPRHDQFCPNQDDRNAPITEKSETSL